MRSVQDFLHPQCMCAPRMSLCVCVDVVHLDMGVCYLFGVPNLMSSISYIKTGYPTKGVGYGSGYSTEFVFFKKPLSAIIKLWGVGFRFPNRPPQILLLMKNIWCDLSITEYHNPRL